VNGGTFHPNSAGQTTLARVVACYLNANPTPPDPFVDGAAKSSIDVPTTELVSPASLGLAPLPGSTAPFPGCT